MGLTKSGVAQMWPVYPVVARVPGSPLTSSVEAAALVVADTYRRFQSRRRRVFSHGELLPVAFRLSDLRDSYPVGSYQLLLR